MLDQVWCIFVKIFNVVFNQTFEWIIDIMIWVLQLLPPTPFVFEPIKWGVIGQSIGYYVPIEKMLLHLSYILSALLVWYAVQHIVRALRIIR